jgi:hypothetical protein
VNLPRGKGSMLRGWPPRLWPALLLFASACSDTEPEAPLSPWVPTGIIEGRISAGGLPIDAEVTARMVGLPAGDRCWVEAQTDSAGNYRLDLPVGAYLLVASAGRSVYYTSADALGIAYCDEAAETLRIASAETQIRADFVLGGLVMDLRAPLDLDGSYVWLEATGQAHAGGPCRNVGAWFYDGQEFLSGLVRVIKSGVLPGTYAVKVEFGPGEEEVWFPGVRNAAQAESVVIFPGKTTSLSLEIPGPPAYLEGRITGSWQAMGLSWPRVTPLNADSIPLTAPQQVDEAGGFCFPLYFPEPLRLHVEIEESVGWIGGEDFASATLFDVHPGETVSKLDFEESGLIIEWTDPSLLGNNLPFDVLLVHEEDLRPYRKIYARDIWQYGRYAAPSLDPGTYLVQFRNSYLGVDWYTQWYDGAASPEAALPVTVPASGGVVRIFAALEEGGAISGTILDDQMEDPPFEYAIYVVDAESGEVVGSRFTQTDYSRPENPEIYTAQGLPDGTYKIGALPRETYDVPASPPAGSTIWYPATPDFNAAGIVSITNHVDVSGIDITMPAGN